MTHKLLKKTALALALFASALTFGQVDLSFTDPGTLKVATDGTLSGGTISFTLENIPPTKVGGGAPNAFNIRIQPKTNQSYNTPSSIADDSYPLNHATASGGSANFTFTDVANTTNSSNIDRTFTVNNIPLIGAVLDDTQYVITLRFAQAGPAGTAALPDSFVSPPASIEGGAGKHALYVLHDLEGPSSLGLSEIINNIPNAVVNAENGTISVSGANLDAVYAISGQQVDATNLANGIYIVQISKGNKKAAVKVIL